MIAVAAVLLLGSLSAADTRPSLADASSNPSCVDANKTGTICPNKTGGFDDCCRQLCSYKEQCLGLDGFCCPNPSGLMLECCLESAAKAVPSGGSQDCEEENVALAKWTFLRYCVLGLIMLRRMFVLYAKAKVAGPEGSEHPELTERMLKGRRLEESLVLAGVIFVLTEGIGLAIYFAVSAIMDNIAIFLFSVGDFCKTVSAIALYTMAVVTFLPNVVIGMRLQGTWYNRKSMTSKALFIVFMCLITAASFGVRMLLVYNAGWAAFLDSLLQDAPSWFKLMLSVLVPPLVDGIQSCALILTGVKAEPPDQVPDQVPEPSCPVSEPTNQMPDVLDAVPDPPPSDLLLPKIQYYPGQIVKVRQDHGTWVQARVKNKRSDGSFDVWLRYVRRMKSSLDETDMSPWPEGSSIYSKYEVVKVYSERMHKWISATVKVIHTDQSCDVEWAEIIQDVRYENKRNIPLHDQRKEMKPTWCNEI